MKINNEGVYGDDSKLAEAFTANFDGKDVPVTGDPNIDTISMKRLNATTVERIGKKGGKVVLNNTCVVSADGKQLTVKG